jgi:anti-sigma-K factor RskA
MNHDEWIERAEIYALGALDGEELTQFEAHLALDCPVCENRLRETRETLTLLPRSLPPIAPPSAIRESVLARIAAPSAPPPLVIPRRRWRWWGLAVNAPVAAGLLIALSLNLYQTRQALHHLEGVASALRAELNRREQALQTLSANLESARQELQRVEGMVMTLQAELAKRDEVIQAERQELQHVQGMVATLQTELAERDDTLRLLASSQVRRVRLAGLPPSPGAAGQLLWNPEARSGLLLTSGLPPTPPNRIYELWAIAGDEPVPAGIFAVDEGGHALLRLPQLSKAKKFTKFAVTLEPTGGVPKPSGPMLLLGSL